MGTRSIVQVVGNTEPAPDPGEAGSRKGAIRLYRNYDGGPEHCLPAIARAVQYVESLVESNRMWRDHGVRFVGPEPMAFAIMAHSMTSSYMTMSLEETYREPPSLSQLGADWDIEWLYVVDCSHRVVNMFTAKQPSELYPNGAITAKPVAHLAAGLVTLGTLHEVYEDRKGEVEALVTGSYTALESVDWRSGVDADPYWMLTRELSPFDLRKVAWSRRAAAMPRRAPKQAAADPAPEPQVDIGSAYCI